MEDKKMETKAAETLDAKKTDNDPKTENKDYRTSTNDKTATKTPKNNGSDFVADRTSDLASTPMDVDAQRDELDPKRGEKLAEEAVEKNSRDGGNVKIVDKNGIRSAVATPLKDNSDNGKVYSDERINPRDTNAPDAGLTPDGRRIAE